MLIFCQSLLDESVGSYNVAILGHARDPAFRLSLDLAFDICGPARLAELMIADQRQELSLSIVEANWADKWLVLCGRHNTI